jgi:allantoicase
MADAVERTLYGAPMTRDGLIDLAAARVGGRALLASDEFFAPKENLLMPGRGVFLEGKYTDRGKWMDGWETRRRRGPGYDWCIIRLGIPGVIRAITVDTNHFRGNHPASCSLDAVELSGTLAAKRLRGLDDWAEILARSPLTGHAENDFPIRSDGRFTHLRLNIYPDGGVARLRVWGEARPDWQQIACGRPATRGKSGRAGVRDGGAIIDLAGVEHGGLPLATSDQFFSEPLNLIMPGRPQDMGDGWETRRRRGPGHDWVILRLGRRGTIEHIELDTTHFKGNFPESASLEGCDAPEVSGAALLPDGADWRELLPRTKLRANARHRLPVGRTARHPVTHVRLNIFPDGGVARLRLWGRIVD